MNNNLNLINMKYTDRPNIEELPNLKTHLLQYRDLLINRPQTGTLESAFGKGYWYVLTTSRRVKFTEPKIVCPYRSKTNTFGYNEAPWYGITDIYFITKKNNEDISLLYLLALLNSKLYYIWLYYQGKRKGETLELFQKPLSEIPIKEISEDKQAPFISLVDKIIEAKKYNPDADTSELESKIDKIVYELYGLTKEEIAIVEDSVK